MKKLISFTAGTTVFILLPLFGWGIFDLGGFISNVYRLLYLVMIFLLLISMIMFVQGSGQSYKQRLKALMHQKPIVILTHICSIITLLISPYLDRIHFGITFNGDLIRILGLALSFFGFLLMNWSIILIGKQFRLEITAKEYRKLISIGPYKYIRHARFLGIIAFYTGIPLLFDTMLPLLLVLLLSVVLMLRINSEEKQMQTELSDDWTIYKKSTRTIIPFIY